MKIKKINILILFLFLVVILSLGSVAATDDVANTVDTNSADNNEIQLNIENNENSTNDVQDNLGLINVDENMNSEILATSTVNIETNDVGNFTELQTAINGKLAGETLVLTKNYTRVIGDSDLTINKSIVIDAQGFTINGNNFGVIFNVTNTADLTLKNAVLIKGTGVNFGSYKYGGAIYSEGKLNICNSTFKDNTAHFGSAIYNEGAGFTISNSTFTDNTANLDGGAINNVGDGFTIVNSTFIGNNATYGGAIYNEGDSFTIVNSTFKDNTATTRSGGAIYNDGADFTVVNSNFTDNTANKCGGVIYNDADNCNVSNSIFTDNTATNQYGGAIYNDGADFTISNSTFIGNNATYGGAINNYNGADFTVVNSTFKDNTAKYSGGAIDNDIDNGVTGFTVSNSLFINNTNEIICNSGELFIDNVTADENDYITNKGTITSAVIINVGNGSDIHVISGELMDLEANVTASGISVIGEFKFIINNTKILASYNKEFKMYRAEYTPDFVGTKTVNASLAGAENATVLTASIVATNGNSFYDLNATIRSAEGNIVNLTNNYKFNPRTDSAFVDGIVIDNNLTINGNGFTIDGFKLARIFNVTSTGNLTLKNAILINGMGITNIINITKIANITNGTLAGAIFSKGIISIYNSTFKDNTADIGGAIVNYKGANFTVVDSSFTGNNAAYGGAIVNYKGANFTVVDSSFTGNNVTMVGAIVNYKGANFTVLDSSFTGNNATIGGAIFNMGKNFYIIDSTFTGNNATKYGGVIYNEGDNFTIINSIFIGNTAPYGGTINNYGCANFTILNSTFTGNTATEYGGAIENAGVGFTIVNSTFNDNTAPYGGVIDNYGEGANFTIINSTFTGNNATEYGGAISNDKGANFTVVDSIFTGNNASARGGAICSINSTVCISDSTFTGNSASVYGGAIYLGSDIGTIEDSVVLNCNFSNNVAGIDGGAVFSFVTVDIENSTFVNNVVGAGNGGGAVYIGANESLVYNCSFISNYALLHGGAIYLDAYNSTIMGSKFYNNTVGEYGGAILVYHDNNSIICCDFVNNDAPNGTVVGVYKGYNLDIVDCNDFNNRSSSAEIYLDTNETSLANVKVVVLDNSTIYADYLDTIDLTAVVTVDGLTVSGGNLTFNDGYNVYTATDLGNGTYIAEYTVNYFAIRTINAEFANALNGTVYSAAVDSRVLDLAVSDVVMYYKDGRIVASLSANGQPLAGETIAMTINGVSYNFTTNDDGVVMIPIGLNAGEYSIYTIYNLSYRYVDKYSSLTVLPTIAGEDVSLYYRNGSSYAVKVVDSLGQAVVNQLVRMNINGVFYDRVTDDKGIAYLPIGLNAGSYIITAENLANGEMTSNTIVVLPTLVGEDVSLYHRNGSGYSVKVFNKDGSAAAFANVRMNINGVFYTVTADENGTAFLPIGLAVGKYIITTEYDGFMTSNTINVLPVLIGEDISLSYRDGTNYTVKVLNGQGNPLANVTVCMNINGVFYDRITNATGVADLPIGLLPGQYIITTTYADHITSNNITVLPDLTNY